MCDCLAEHMKPCELHGDDPWACPDQLFSFSPQHGYGIPVRDGGGSHVCIAFCPFCGERLAAPGDAAEGLRDRNARLTAERDAILRWALKHGGFGKRDSRKANEAWWARGKSGYAYGVTAEEAVRKAAGQEQQESNADG